MPVLVFLSQSQSASPTAIASPRMKSRVVVYCTPADTQVDEPVERAGPGDVLRDPAEVGEHLVGEDDRDRDRDQRLAQLLTLVPAEERLLHPEAHERRPAAHR